VRLPSPFVLLTTIENSAKAQGVPFIGRLPAPAVSFYALDGAPKA
jgi:hypothetical protein